MQVYAHYLEAIIYFEQMDDEKKDIKPLIRSKKKIDFFIKNILKVLTQLI